MNTAVKLIAFDLGGVLIDVNKSGCLFETAFFESSLFTAFVHGQMKPSDYFSQLSLALGVDALVLERNFNQMVHPKKVCFDILPRLRCPFSIWSNINVCHYEHICHIVPVLRNRQAKDGLSFEMGVSKPRPQFFEKALSALNFSPSSILFFDDNAKNIATAREFGINARLVENEATLAITLRSLNLL